MIAGEFDLSVGSMIGFAGMVLAIGSIHFGLPVWQSIIIAYVLSVALGAFNGFLVIRRGLPSFIVTLAFLYILRGLTIFISVTATSKTILSGMKPLAEADWLAPIFGGEVLTGLFLGVITLMDKGMELAIGFHAGNNVFISLLVTADWTVFQTNSIIKNVGEPDLTSMMVPFFIIYPLLILYFSKKYNWTDWKENLSGRIN